MDMQFYKGLVIAVVLVALLSAAVGLTLGLKPLLAIYGCAILFCIVWYKHTNGFENVPEMEG